MFWSLFTDKGGCYRNPNTTGWARNILQKGWGVRMVHWTFSEICHHLPNEKPSKMISSQAAPWCQDGYYDGICIESVVLVQGAQFFFVSLSLSIQPSKIQGTYGTFMLRDSMSDQLKPLNHFWFFTFWMPRSRRMRMRGWRLCLEDHSLTTKLAKLASHPPKPSNHTTENTTACTALGLLPPWRASFLHWQALGWICVAQTFDLSVVRNSSPDSGTFSGQTNQVNNWWNLDISWPVLSEKRLMVFIERFLLWIWKTHSSCGFYSTTERVDSGNYITSNVRCLCILVLAVACSQPGESVLFRKTTRHGRGRRMTGPWLTHPPLFNL